MFSGIGDKKTVYLRFMVGGFVLLLIAALYLSSTSFIFLYEQQQREAKARIQYIADTLATQMTRAVQFGIPLERLNGIENLFAKVKNKNSDIRSINLIDLSHKDAPIITTASNLRALAPIKIQDKNVALIVVERYQLALAKTASLVGFILLVVLIAICATTLLAAEAVRYALRAGLCLRDHVIETATSEAKAGRFHTLFIGGWRRPFDLRAQWLATAMRRVNEQHVRVRRLIESLRQTEPDTQRRRVLDQLLEQTSAGDQFAVATPQVVRFFPTQTQARWLLLLIGCSAESLRILWAPEQLHFAGWGIAISAIGTIIGFHIAARLRIKASRLVFATILIIALTLLVNLLANKIAVLLAMRFIAGSALGALLALINALPSLQLMREGSAIQPGESLHWPLVGWVIGIEWLAPVMATLSLAAFGLPISTLLLLLPLLATIACTWRWATMHSPWREITVPKAIVPHFSLITNIAGLVLGALVCLLANGLFAIAPNDWLFNSVLWTANGLGAVVALSYKKIPHRLVYCAALIGPCLLASAAWGIQQLLWPVLILGVGLTSLGWWYLYTLRSMSARLESIYSFALGAVLQALAHQLLSDMQIVAMWIFMAIVVSIICASVIKWQARHHAP